MRTFVECAIWFLIAAAMTAVLIWAAEWIVDAICGDASALPLYGFVYVCGKCILEVDTPTEMKST